MATDLSKLFQRKKIIPIAEDIPEAPDPIEIFPEESKLTSTDLSLEQKELIANNISKIIPNDFYIEVESDGNIYIYDNEGDEHYFVDHNIKKHLTKENGSSIFKVTTKSKVDLIVEEYNEDENKLLLQTPYSIISSHKKPIQDLTKEQTPFEKLINSIKQSEKETFPFNNGHKYSHDDLTKFMEFLFDNSTEKEKHVCNFNPFSKVLIGNEELIDYPLFYLYLRDEWEFSTPINFLQEARLDDKNERILLEDLAYNIREKQKEKSKSIVFFSIVNDEIVMNKVMHVSFLNHYYIF